MPSGHDITTYFDGATVSCKPHGIAARQAGHDEAGLMQELLISMMIWIGAATGLQVPAVPPHIVIVGPAAMQERFGSVLANVPGHFVASVYRTATMSIYLSTSWDIAVVADRSVLAHELTHYMQHRDGLLRGKCRGELERQAESVQRAWMRHEGGDQDAVPALSQHYECATAKALMKTG